MKLEFEMGLIEVTVNYDELVEMTQLSLNDDRHIMPERIQLRCFGPGWVDKIREFVGSGSKFIVTIESVEKGEE